MPAECETDEGFEQKLVIGLFRRKQDVEGYEAMVARLQERLSLGSPWDRVSVDEWRTMLEAPLVGWERSSSVFAHGRADEAEPVALMVALPGEVPAARIEATLEALVIPREMTGEAALFCVAANRFFRYWNLYLVWREDGYRIVSAATFDADEHGPRVPTPLLETLVLRAVRAAVIATPALHALVSGVNPEDAVTIADQFDDTVGYDEHPHGLPGVDDRVLIDEALAAIDGLGVSPPRRPTPTQLFFGAPRGDAFVTAYVDAIGGNVLVTCYPLEPIPEERLVHVAAAMSLIAATGVAFTFALDLDGGLVRFKNGASFRGVGQRKLLLRALVRQVIYGPLLYERPLRQVAFEDADPASVVEAAEQLFNEFRDRPRDALEILAADEPAALD